MTHNRFDFLDLVKAFGRRVLSPFLGKVRYYPFFEALYELSLAGMNFGEGANPSTSGEVAALHYVRDKLPLRQGPVVFFDVGANRRYWRPEPAYDSLLLGRRLKTGLAPSPAFGASGPGSDIPGDRAN